MAFLLQFVSLAVFTFGAPAFCVLAFSYWRQGHRGSKVFRAFTLVCAAAFVGSLASAAIPMDYRAADFVRALLTAVLPPMMAHLVLEQRPNLGRHSLWRMALGLLYAAAVLSALAGESRWSGAFESSSQFVLAGASVFALTVLLAGRGEGGRNERRQRAWYFIVFSALLLLAVAAAASDNPIFGLAPDYLLLLFFAVRLYYTERLALFDVFVKGGTYFAAGSILFAVALLAVPPFRSVFASDWVRAWLGILALMPVWLLGPLLYHRLSRWTDRALHRKYSPIQAERLFMQAAQGGPSEPELSGIAVATLGEIFCCAVEVEFGNGAPILLDGDLATPLSPVGWIRLAARENQVPFLSDDRRLLETLSATLSVLLQNARLRYQQQDQLRREQELASLASRAELRALRAQINPHFLFNALNAIAGWIQTEPEFADETLAQLAEVFRYTLHRSQNEWVTVREEADFIRSYLSVEGARFGDRLVAEVAIDPRAEMVSIPAMVIQPLIENAIKHGACQTSAASKMLLAIRLHGPVLRMEVCDQGPGFPEGFTVEGLSGGLGLRNVADRLKGYYGEGGILRWENTPDGCRVTIEVPVATREEEECSGY